MQTRLFTAFVFVVLGFTSCGDSESSADTAVNTSPFRFKISAGLGYVPNCNQYRLATFDSVTTGTLKVGCLSDEGEITSPNEDKTITLSADDKKRLDQSVGLLNFKAILPAYYAQVSGNDETMIKVVIVRGVESIESYVALTGAEKLDSAFKNFLACACDLGFIPGGKF